MRKQFKKNYDEVSEEATKYDDELLLLIKNGNRKLIIEIIKDYLSQPES